VTRHQTKRSQGLFAARVAVCISLMAVALLVGAGAAARAAGPTAAATSTESLRLDTAPDAAVDDPATTSPAARSLVPVGSRLSGGAFPAIVLSALAMALAGRARRLPRTPLVLDDVGDRWRALLIGAPPARSSF